MNYLETNNEVFIKYFKMYKNIVGKSQTFLVEIFDMYFD